MSDRFGQLDRTVHGCDFARFDFDWALSFTVGTIDASEFFQSDFASPFFLDPSAKALPECVGGQLDLIEMWNFVALL
jgi:hypothetical protein